jgi:PAS domain S-box-containing protein
VDDMPSGSGAAGRLRALEEENARLRRERDAARAGAALAQAVLASATDDAIVTTDRAGRVTSWNVGARVLLGWGEDEAVGMDSRLTFTPEDRAAGAPEAEREKAAREGRAAGERWRVRKDGSRFWGSGVTVPLRGDRGGFLQTLRDRTEERRTADALAASERHFRAVAELVPDLLWSSDVRAGADWFNRRWTEYTGQTSEEAAGFGWLRVVHPDDRDASVARFRRAVETGEPLRQEHRIRRASDGAYRWFQVRAVPVRDGEGRVASWFGAVTDIHDHRAALEALRASEVRLGEAARFLDFAFDAFGAAEYDVDLRTGAVRPSPRLDALYGLPPGRPGGVGRFRDRYHPDDRAAMESIVPEAARTGGGHFQREFRIVRPDGEVRWVLSRGQVLFDAEGRPERALGAAIDITDRKRTEEALREGEERLRLVARATNDAVMDWDLGTDRIAWSDAIRSVFGYGENDLSVPGAWWKERVHPDDRARVLGDLDRAVAGDVERWAGDYRFRRADGAYADVVDRCLILRDGRGCPRRVVGSLLDVTRHRRAEAALRESEARFRGLVETAPQIVWTSDDAGATWFNPRWHDYTGLPPGGGLGGSWHAVVHPDDLPAAVERAAASVATGRDYETEYRLRRADGSYRWHIARAIRLPEGGGWIGVATDIDDLKRAQGALRESEERFRQFAEATDDVLWIVDAETARLEYVSPAFETVWGEPRDAVLADLGRWAALLHPDDRERALGGLPAILGGESLEQEYRIVRPSDGAERWIRDKGFPVRGPDGRVRRAVGLARDITARREGDERQVVLLQELAHRVKNTLAVILAMAQQTGLRAADLAGFLEAFEGRLRALAAAHDLLTDSGWRSTPVSALAEAALAAHGDGPGDGRFRVELADDVTLRPAAAQSLVLALHELATNATKHGALSRPGGQVTLEGRAEDGELVLAWRESGGPPVARPAAAGFGTALLHQVVAYQHEGRVEVEWRREGLACTLRLPLAAVAERASPP